MLSLCYKKYALSIAICIVSGIIYFLATTPYHDVASIISQLYPGPFTTSAVYNASSYYNWTSLLRDNYKIIQNEFHEFERLTKSSCHQNTDYATNWDQKWATVNLFRWGVYNDNILKYFPKTLEIIKTVQTQNWIRLAEFSVLQSGKFIPRHRGVYAGQLTYQLTIETPDEVNDYIKSDNIEGLQKQFYLAIWDNTSVPLHYWPSQYIPNVRPSLITWIANGSDVLFDDSSIHEAYNGLSKRRVVLIIDPERNDENFKNSWVTQIIHKYIIQTFIPYLASYQKYVDITPFRMARNNPNIRDAAHSCKFNGINESEYDYNYDAIYVNELESNASSVRQQWYTLINDSQYIYNINKTTKHHGKKHVNIDMLAVSIMVLSFSVTGITAMICK